MKKLLRLPLACSLLAGLPACGLTQFADRATNPIIQEYSFGSGQDGTMKVASVIATSAGRRVVIATSDGKFCAEPPPDVAESYANAIALAAAAKVQNAPVEVSASFGRDFATRVAPLMYRTQGLQFYRDGNFRLCNDFANGTIDGAQYKELHSKLIDAAAEMIKQEIPYMAKIVAPALQNSLDAPETTVSAGASSSTQGSTATAGAGAVPVPAKTDKTSETPVKK
jgi:hypothetical protein